VAPERLKLTRKPLRRNQSLAEKSEKGNIFHFFLQLFIGITLCVSFLNEKVNQRWQAIRISGFYRLVILFFRFYRKNHLTIYQNLTFF